MIPFWLACRSGWSCGLTIYNLYSAVLSKPKSCKGTYAVYAIGLLASGITVAHWFYKGVIDRRIRNGLSDMAAKKTFLYLGTYPSSKVTAPIFAPVEVVSLCPPPSVQQ